MTMFYALLSCCLFGGALAQVSSLGSCPEVQTKPNFNISRYLGQWYEAERYFAAFEVNAKCVVTDYRQLENGMLRMVNSRTSRVTGLRTSVEATARIPDLANPAKLKVKFALDPIGIETDYWILGTDYENFAVVYNCIDSNLKNYKLAWILTRERHPEQSVIDKAVEIVKKNKLHRENFLKSDQSNC